MPMIWPLAVGAVLFLTYLSDSFPRSAAQTQPFADAAPAFTLRASEETAEPIPKIRYGEYEFNDPRLNLDRFRVQFDGEILAVQQPGGWVLGYSLLKEGLQWSFLLSAQTDAYISRPKIVGNTVFVLARNGQIFAIDKFNGELRFIAQAGIAAVSGLVNRPGGRIAFVASDVNRRWVLSEMDVYAGRVEPLAFTPLCPKPSDVSLEEKENILFLYCGTTDAWSFRGGQWFAEAPSRKIPDDMSENTDDTDRIEPRPYVHGQFKVFDSPPRLRLIPPAKFPKVSPKGRN